MPIKRMIKRGIRAVQNRIHTPNKHAILLFGQNKAGTSAAINLIAKASKSTFTDDFWYHLGGFEQVYNGDECLESYINRYSYAFSKDIIRFWIDDRGLELAESYFDMNKFILVVRNPLDNIKSLLSRLSISGSAEEVSIDELPKGWQWMFKREAHFIDSLCRCWLDAYDRELPQKDNCVLFKYEDFLKDKSAYITDKLKELGLEKKRSIDKTVDQQFQPKGSGKKVREFFSDSYYNRIIERTGKVARKYGYESL